MNKIIVDLAQNLKEGSNIDYEGQLDLDDPNNTASKKLCLHPTGTSAKYLHCSSNVIVFSINDFYVGGTYYNISVEEMPNTQEKNEDVAIGAVRCCG